MPRSQRTQQLPVIDNCDGCGVCCLEQESPPGYVMLLADLDADWGELWEDDVERVKRLPPELVEELLDYARTLHSRTGGGPCIWYDQHKRIFKHHEHRPSICREMDVGGEGCRRWRAAYHVLPF